MSCGTALPCFGMVSREAVPHQEKAQCKWADPKPEMQSEGFCFSYLQEAKPDVPVRILHELFPSCILEKKIKNEKALDPGLMVHLSKKCFSKNKLTSHME